ncbi:Fur family transcriptional regulator [Streptomyces hydrogenans]
MGWAESGQRTRPRPGEWRRTTRQREAVYTALACSPDFVSAKALRASLVANRAPAGLTTVYRALQALERAGQVDVIRDKAGERFYRIRPAGVHRHYLMCRKCGRSHPIDAEAVDRWVSEVSAESGFTDICHTLELTGVCADCHAAQLPLADRGRGASTEALQSGGSPAADEGFFPQSATKAPRVP